MKRLLTLTVIATGLLGIGSACHKQDSVVVPTPAPPVVVTMPADTNHPWVPLITAIAIEGIPEENVSIDQATKLITVVVPEVPVQVESVVSVTLTPGYTLYPGGSGYTYKLNLFYYNSPLPLYDAKNSQVASYKVTLRQTRPLEIGVAGQPLLLLTGSPLVIPVKNYYDDSNGATAVLTNTVTGQQLKGSIGIAGNYFDRTYIPNQVWATFDADLPAGEYTLDIVKDNGRTAHGPQLVTIKRGLPMVYIDYGYQNYAYPGSRGVRVTGVNLYAGDQIELLLTSRAGEQYRLTPASYTPGGKGLTLDLPANLKPVPYFVQMIRKGQVVESYSRLVLRKDINQPAIVDFLDVPLTVDPTQTVSLQRGKTQPFTLVYSPNIAKVRLRFASVTNPAIDYRIDAAHIEGYLGFGPDAGYPDFTLPPTMPTGRYTVWLQYVLRDGTMVEGEPLERDVEVR